MNIQKNIVIILGMVLLFPMTASAQASQSNPDQYVIIAEGQKKVNDQIRNQTDGQQKTAALQGAIAAEFTIMKGWEGKYVSYLKTVRGYAESLKAGTSIYADGVEVLRNIYDLRKAIGHNPVGIAATLSLNDLYLEVGTEFVKVFKTLQSVAKGEKTNMLRGSERTDLLWRISDQLADLNRKLRQLVISIAYHNMMDVWNRYTAGLIDRDKGVIASEALDRWRRASKVASVLTH
ncbi:MAG: hypothetical protein AUK63_1978 [bacterium P3]|nr:MAG: hypothetical protein AUK63_1978 [bacterium P3]KWW34444.1 MAG: hypothetical protein F083_2475 [bacterium F083]